MRLFIIDRLTKKMTDNTIADIPAEMITVDSFFDQEIIGADEDVIIVI